MATIEDVARHIAGIAATEEDVLLIGQWVNERWRELANTNTLRHLRRTGELTTTAPENTGTVAVTKNSSTVAGTGTTWTDALNGQYFRQKTNWYEVSVVTSATTLELKSVFTEDTTTGAGYNIVQRRYRLEPNVRQLLPVFSHMRLRRTLEVSSREGLDLAIPSRFSINNAPQYVVEVYPDPDGTKVVEIYPFTKDSELLHYVYWMEAPDLAFKDQLPAFIDIEALREGVMVDYLRHKMFKLSEEGKPREAELMRNEFRAQETLWKRDHKHRLIGQDNALDDLEIILTRSRAHPFTNGTGNRVIDDAFDHIFYTGSF